MSNKISLVGCVLGIIGCLLVAFNFSFFALIVWVPGNLCMIYVNKADKNQLFMWVIYEIINIIGIVNYIY
jgi:hypothetical protein